MAIEENANFLINNNMAVKINKANGGVGIIKDILQNREELDSMHEFCKTFSKTDAIVKILELIKGKIKESAIANWRSQIL